MNENESADPLEITQGEALMAYLACGYTQFYETLDIFRRMLDSSKEEVAPVIPILPYESKTKNVL